LGIAAEETGIVTTIACAAPSRRYLMLGALTLFALAGCSYFDSPGRVAYQLRSGGFAIELQRGFSRPVAPGDVTVFRRNAPQDWNRIPGGPTTERLVNDFNTNPDGWLEMPSFRQRYLWGRPPAPPF
jgi:hypothetical protein